MYSRLTKVFHAPLMEGDVFDIDPSQKLALEVIDATFEWEESLSTKEAKEAMGKGKKGKNAKLPADKDLYVADAPFQVRNITMQIPRGSLVAIVGAVGSGKVINILTTKAMVG